MAESYRRKVMGLADRIEPVSTGRGISQKQMEEEALENSQRGNGRGHTSPLTDMRRSREDKEKIMNPPPVDPVELIGDYPYGLCLCFDAEILEKLDLDADEIRKGDTIDLRAFATVTCALPGRVELQITNLAVENENTEDVGA